ncbi:Capsule polysaccharide biosynthesis protein [Pleurostoma richardsiae]|uniref:Capsule polysaccharide biosynthesis protein n=1 Tax=Pleurostoma richardsiae TaxID=41990 RepID=A0AA38RQZ2_9PEZI|nr:Capsule polysaccharide biosynthesis protein [Pleurostoma richardsiae]
MILVFIVINIKSLPFMWHVRFLRTFIRRLTDPAPSVYLSPRCLFLPAINTTRSPLFECDYNIHKSNSTYFTDLDISRGNISLVLFRKPFNPFPGPNQLLMVLGGAQCVWRKEIKPYQSYELWTRVLSWDEKWIYLVSHFVERGRFVPQDLFDGDETAALGRYTDL